MTCERCTQATESGIVLVSSTVFWHDKPSFLLEPPPAFPGATLGRADYYPFPFSLPARRCRACGWVLVEAGQACAHVRAPGFIFPRASLRWYAGEQPFQAGVWFALNGKTKDGAECEALVQSGFVLSVVDTRVAAARCTLCGSVAFQADRGAPGPSGGAA